MNTLLIVDGSNLLFQMFYGMPSRIFNSNGFAIHGTLGFIGALLKMARWYSPSHIIVVFDGECENARCELSPDYKANRPDFDQLPEEDIPFSQLPHIFSCLDTIGIRYYETESCEADDVIAAYALKYGKAEKVIISSQDSDFFQLISENIHILRYRGESSVLCTQEYIKEKLGIFPFQYADYKSLVGDKADNIKGAEGIGPKTASLLLKEFSSLDTVIDNADEIKKEHIRNSIKANEDRLRLNYKLIKLSASSEIPFDYDDLKFTYNGETTNQILKKSNVL
ncbi:MAG: flap endonuclease [Clostridia bacterium]|nr:flap endonuclease [Clostridia bacterium]